jgi:hypothetical protein
MEHDHSSKPFPFLDLPPELRDLVYENLLEDPYFPPPPTCAKHAGFGLPSFDFWSTVVPGRRASEVVRAQAKRKSNWVFLANKQTYAEYMDLLVKRTTFHLTVSPANYQPLTPDPSSPPSTPSDSPAPSPAPQADKRIWHISENTLKSIRKCDIKLITTSSMLGVLDPRTMAPSSWALAHQIKSELSNVSNIRELNLHVKAIGDPLWNPLWVWYHATQSFLPMGHWTSSPSTFTGPKLNKISFSLDTWSPGENYLERNEDAEWEWRCEKKHCVVKESNPDGKETTVREFCARLYMECRECRPELESDDEDD